MKKCILLILFIALLCGCNETVEKQQETVKMKANEDQKEMKGEETLWTIVGDDGEVERSLPENDKDVEQIKDIISQHCEYVDNRSAENLFINDEMKLYTEGFRKSLKESSYNKSVEDMYLNNVLALELKEIIWYPSTFDTEKDYGKVTIESVFSFTEGKESYLNKNEISLDTLYTQQRIYYLEKRDGIWKISNIQKSALDVQKST